MKGEIDRSTVRQTLPPQLQIPGKKVILRDKTLSDARDDYRWQTDLELVRLDAAPLFTGSLSEYLLDYSSELHFPSSIRRAFAVDTLDGKHIGNCVYYNIDEANGEAEVGIMIGDRDYWGKGYGTDAVATLVRHIFLETKIRRIYLKTLDWNKRAQRAFQKCGFKPYNHAIREGYSFIFMELKREEWAKRQKQV